MSDPQRWANMILHIQAAPALIVTVVSGYTASIVAFGYSSMYRGQPMARLTEIILKYRNEIYWIALPIVIFGLWAMAVVSKSQKKKSTAIVSISILSAASVIVLLVAWSLPLVRTTFALS